MIHSINKIVYPRRDLNGPADANQHLYTTGGYSMEQLHMHDWGHSMEQLHTSARFERDHPRASVVAAIGSLALRPGQRVLDVGCGPGAHLGLFARQVAPAGEVVGLDISGERLVIATNLNQEAIAAGRVALREGDLHALPYDPGNFDVVWTSLVLHHEDDPPAVVSEFARVVKADGRVAVMDSDGGGSFPLLPWEPEFELRLRAAALRAEQARYGDALPHIFRNYLGRRLPAILGDAGLHHVTLAAFSDVERAPLDSFVESEMNSWFIGSFAKRIQAYLAPVDLRRLEAHFTPGSGDYLPGRADFFCARTHYLCVGTTAG